MKNRKMKHPRQRRMWARTKRGEEKCAVNEASHRMSHNVGSAWWGRSACAYQPEPQMRTRPARE